MQVKTKMRALSVALAMLVAPIATGSPVKARSGEAVPSLRAVNDIRVERTASMRVRLPQDLPLFPTFNAEVEFRGNGRALAFLLVKEGRDGDLKWSQTLDGQRLGQCYSPGCKPQTLQTGSMGARGVGKRPTLTAGNYRLYVVNDGAPVRIRLKLPRLEGHARLVPSEPAVAQVKTLTPHIQETNSGAVYSAGDVSPFGGRGLAFVGLWVKSSEREDALVGDCVYEKDAPALETIAYLPITCPQSYYSDYQTTGAANPEYDETGFTLTLDHLPAAIGTWYAATSPVEEAGSTGLWLKTP